eukprot:g893.t1
MVTPSASSTNTGRRSSPPDTILGEKFWNKCEALVKRAGYGETIECFTPLSPPKTVKRLLKWKGPRSSAKENHKDNAHHKQSSDGVVVASSPAFKLSLREKKARVKRRLLRESERKKEVKREQQRKGENNNSNTSNKSPVVEPPRVAFFPPSATKSAAQRQHPSRSSSTGLLERKSASSARRREKHRGDDNDERKVEHGHTRPRRRCLRLQSPSSVKTKEMQLKNTPRQPEVDMYERLLEKGRERESALKKLLEKEQEQSRSAQQALRNETEALEVLRRTMTETAESASFAKEEAETVKRQLDAKVAENRQLVCRLESERSELETMLRESLETKREQDLATARQVANTKLEQLRDALACESERSSELTERLRAERDEVQAWRERYEVATERARELEDEVVTAKVSSTTTDDNARLVEENRRLHDDIREWRNTVKDLRKQAAAESSTMGRRDVKMRDASTITAVTSPTTRPLRSERSVQTDAITSTREVMDGTVDALRKETARADRLTREVASMQLEFDRRTRKRQAERREEREESRRAIESIRRNYESQLVDMQDELAQRRRHERDVGGDVTENTMVSTNIPRNDIDASRVRLLAAIEAVATDRSRRRRRTKGKRFTTRSPFVSSPPILLLFPRDRPLNRVVPHVRVVVVKSCVKFSTDPYRQDRRRSYARSLRPMQR